MGKTAEQLFGSKVKKKKFQKHDPLFKERTALAGIERKELLAGMAATPSIDDDPGSMVTGLDTSDAPFGPKGQLKTAIKVGEEAFKKKRKKAADLSSGSLRGRRGTILTGSAGVSAPLGAKRKTLLGG